MCVLLITLWTFITFWITFLTCTMLIVMQILFLMYVIFIIIVTCKYLWFINFGHFSLFGISIFFKFDLPPFLTCKLFLNDLFIYKISNHKLITWIGQMILLSTTKALNFMGHFLPLQIRHVLLPVLSTMNFVHTSSWYIGQGPSSANLKVVY